MNAGPFPQPLPMPILVDERGYAWLPPLTPGEPSADDFAGWFVHEGVRVAWAQIAPAGALLHMLGGQNAQPGFEEEGITFAITRQGIEQLIADLSWIVVRMGGAS